MRDVLSNEPCGIHRTFLDKAGRALLDGDGRRIRNMLRRAGGAAVKLVADEEVMLGLGIVEGVEDGLSVMLSGWRPIWVTTSAGAIQRFPVLAAIEALTIFGTRTPSAWRQQNSAPCAGSKPEEEARICSPRDRLRYDFEAPLKDWNDACAMGIDPRATADASWTKPAPKKKSKFEFTLYKNIDRAPRKIWLVEPTYSATVKRPAILGHRVVVNPS